MLSADVVIQTEVGKAPQVVQAIRTIEGVHGPRRLLAPTRHRPGAGPGVDELARLVVARIQKVDGITRTLTCTVIARSATKSAATVRPILPATSMCTSCTVTYDFRL